MKDWRVEVKDGPQQYVDSFNCGLYVLHTMRSLIFENQFNEKSITPRSAIRLKIGEELLKNRIIF
jgi:hypothetical protein